MVVFSDFRRWHECCCNMSQVRIASNLCICAEMKTILQHLKEKHNLNSDRSCWVEAVTSECITPDHEVLKCGRCDECWRHLFTQALMLAKCTNGVGDLMLCRTMGQIFHSERCRSHSLEDWATMPELESATLLRPTSCWDCNTQHLRPHLSHPHEQRQKHPGCLIPDFLDLMQFCDFQSKTAFLVLEGALGVQPGVVVAD
jgi:hypothetical protein